MPDLIVPTPVLQFDDFAPGVAVWEKPVRVQCPAMAFPDGTPFRLEHIGKAGFFIYRQRTAGAAIEIWNENEEVGEWIPDPGTALDNMQPRAFYFEPEEPFPWQGMMIAAGQTDSDGNFQIQLQNVGSNFPQYFFRAYFASTYLENPISGLSAPSAPVRFVNFFGSIRAGLTAGENVIPDLITTDKVILFLRNGSRTQFMGFVKISDDSGNGKIEIVNQTAGGSKISSIQMDSNGDVTIDCGGLFTVLERGVRVFP